MLAALLILATLPNLIDGDKQVTFGFKHKYGSLVLAVGNEALLHYGKGPKEIIPHTHHYDYLSGTVYVGSDFKGFWYKDGELSSVKYDDYSKTIKGSWGDYNIVLHHDYRIKRTAPGRLTLESEDESILLAQLTAEQTAMLGLFRIYAGRNALVLMNNIGRAISYVPLRDGKVRTVHNPKLDTLVAEDMLTFPMPHEMREQPIDLRVRKANDNWAMGDACEIQPGLYAFSTNHDVGYLYDLENVSSYYIGQFPLEAGIIGTQDGKLIVYGEDTDGEPELAYVDPLALVTN